MLRCKLSLSCYPEKIQDLIKPKLKEVLTNDTNLKLAIRAVGV
jgi:hypothetical protein